MGQQCSIELVLLAPPRYQGIARERIHYEFFGPATILDEDEAAAPVPEAGKAVPAASVAPEDGLTVSFRVSGAQVAWDSSCHSLLELAEQAGLTVPFNCRAGLCNTCQTPLLRGEVEYIEPPLEPPADGAILLCKAADRHHAEALKRVRARLSWRARRMTALVPRG
ncbi:2Fe-2S iron-sulfur cluster-binding protein [Neisseriaceae bacterium JH1-16]|nr:2Fe-2S iron-sulfur cluster-binding protein [Neisseriaceae bacterium JH1-16]